MIIAHTFSIFSKYLLLVSIRSDMGVTKHNNYPANLECTGIHEVLFVYEMYVSGCIVLLASYFPRDVLFHPRKNPSNLQESWTWHDLQWNKAQRLRNRCKRQWDTRNHDSARQDFVRIALPYSLKAIVLYHVAYTIFIRFYLTSRCLDIERWGESSNRLWKPDNRNDIRQICKMYFSNNVVIEKV